MANPSKQAQLKAKQDTIAEEVNLLLAEGKRTDAIKHYQSKCACSAERAVAYVDSLHRNRLDKRRDEIMSRMRGRRF
jgi:hypothetical protein